MTPTSFQNRCQDLPKTIQNPVSDASWTPPEGVSETSSKTYSLVLIKQEGFGCPNRAPGASWMASKNLQNFVHFFTSLLHDSNGLLAPNMAPKTHPNPPKIDVHVRVFLGAFLTSDFPSKMCSKVNKAEERRRHFRLGINTICTLSACSTSS